MQKGRHNAGFLLHIYGGNTAFMKQVLILSFLFPLLVQAQDLKQTIRGNIIDRESKATLPGANVLLYADTVFLSGTTTNEDGNFRLEGPVGRVDLVVRYIGYQDFFITNLVVSSGKEVVLQIELEESAQALDEVTITAFREGEVVNDMATVSVRSFTVEETDRYAGSRGDPARMASNLRAFREQMTAEMISSSEAIRLSGYCGGWKIWTFRIPITLLSQAQRVDLCPSSTINTSILTFYRSFSGRVWQCHCGGVRSADAKRNDEQYEFSGQLGFLGTELFAEGPLSKENKSSFLVSYRYSTLQLFESLNIQIGTEAVPRYQDGAVKLFFP